MIEVMTNERNIKCTRCGSRAQISQKVYVDGTYKIISYCKKCVGEIFSFETEKFTRAGIQTIVSHKKLMEESPAKNKKFEFSLEFLYSEQPSTIQLTMFPRDANLYGKIVSDIEGRRLTLLEHKLSKAIRKEDYEKAKKLKKMIDEINKKLKQQPW
ncbi:UvrB/UvrC motif-containing protein [Fervidobacterium riparium]|uniref:UvrB/UvrC motif-containing protein n=1 Tax=Fervidobacterium gondwanense TaxID=44754 RepID=UPI003A700E37